MIDKNNRQFYDYKKIANIENVDINFNNLPFLRKYYDSGLILGGGNIFELKKILRSKKKVAVISGFSLSGKLQIGNITPIKIFKVINKVHPSKLFMPISDTEATLTRKFNKNSSIMYSNFLTDLTIWGFRLKEEAVYLHSKNKEVSRLFNDLVKKFDTKDFEKIYGTRSNFSHSIAVCNMLADILYPITLNFKNIIIILGIEEINHVRLIKLCFKKLKLKEPSFIFLSPINGIYYGKMSKSQPKNSLLLSETKSSLKSKLLALQKNPLTGKKNPLYQIANWILEIDKEELDRTLRELKNRKFNSLMCNKIKNKYLEINNGKNKRSLR